MRNLTQLVALLFIASLVISGCISGVDVDTTFLPTSTPAYQTSTPRPTVSQTTLPAQTAASPRLNGRIFMVSWGGDVSEIYVMSADGSDLTHLFDISPNDEFPAWSPGGQQAALAPMPVPGESTDIYVMNLDDGEAVQMMRSDAWDVSPAWSPDGKQLAFVSDRGISWNIYVMDIECVNMSGGCDGNLTQLTEDVGYKGCLAWSPGGQQIAFDSNGDGNSNLFVLNIPDGSLTRLTDDPAEDMCPTWSPDGQRIAFQSERDGDWNIYTMNADGSDITRLTDNPASDAAPTWSPDGLWIAFQSDRDGNWDVYAMRADGSDLMRITDGLRDYVQPTWLPND
jgi:TolB protein